MLKVRFVRNFILNTILTTLNEDGKYSTEEFSYHISENTYVNNISGYSEHSADTFNIDFNGADGIQGTAIAVLKSNVEIYDTNGSQTPPPTIGHCCK